MPIINTSKFRYRAAPSGGKRRALKFSAAVSATFAPRVKSPFVRASLVFTVNVSARLRPRSRRSSGLLFRVEAFARLSPQVKLNLTMPEPILPTSANFRNGFFIARLFQNGTALPLKSFTVAAPKDSLSKSISASIAGFDKNLINTDALFKLQIGQKPARDDDWEWFTVADGAKLQNKSFELRFPGDALAFTASAEDNRKLQTAPPAPRIVFDSGKIQIGDNPGTITTETGAEIRTQSIGIAGLTLEKLLDFAFVAGCGFSSVKTDLPNYEISRCDFPLTSTYLEAVAGFLALWKPLFRVEDGNTLVIQKKTTVPADFSPAPLAPDVFSSYSESTGGLADVDGIILSYTQKASENHTTTSRSEYLTEESGVYGTAGYTRIDTVRSIRDYKAIDNPAVILKSEITSETRSTYDHNSNLIARETETHTLDRSGKRLSTAKTSENRVPNLEYGTLALLTTSDDLTVYSYIPDPTNIRRTLQNRSVTQQRRLIAVDGENTYFGDPFKQDFIEAHKAGNLRDGMTSEFGPVKTVTESLQTLGNGQTQINVQTVDHLRNTITNSISETRSGESSLGAENAASRQMVIYRAGYTRRRKHATLNVGELPLIFALPLAKLELERLTNGETSATIEISGFDENLTRGVFLDVRGRSGDSMGIYLCEGVTVEGVNLGTREQRVTTKIDASLIKREN